MKLITGINLTACLRFIIAVAASAAIASVTADEYDLSPPGPQSATVTGDVGGAAIFSDHWEQPTGTGVFDPFLTVEANGPSATNSKVVEQGYNTDGHSHLYLDQQRPEWNTYLKFKDLADINIDGNKYYGFILDSNEPGGTDKDPKNLISIDNIRIYTSPSDTTGGVQNNVDNLNNLGKLRWALNDPTKTGGDFNIQNWIKLDSEQENVLHSNANGGSGQADMVVYVPATAFGDTKPDDYIWFYNLNGVHYDSDVGSSADAGYEEWSAVVGPHAVPDNGATITLLGIGICALGALRRKIN
jgi:hypothetical protein